MNKTAFILCLAIVIISPLLFGSVYTFACTPVFLIILAAGLFTLKAGVNKNSITGIWQLQWPANPLLPLFLGFLVYLILQMIPLPGSMLTHLSIVAKVVSEKSLPAASISGMPVHEYWDTLAPYIYPVRMSLVRWIIYGIFLWSFMAALNSRKKIEIAVITILCLGCFESLYGIIQSYSGYEHIWWYKKIEHLGFPSGTYLNRNHFAGFMEIGIILSVAYAVMLYDRHQKKHSGNKYRLKGIRAKIAHFFSAEQLYTRIFLVIFTGVIMGLGLMLSGSRGGIISVALALVVMGIFFTGTKAYRRPGLYILIPFLILTSVYSITAGIDVTVDRFRFFDADFLNRAVLAEKTLRIFDDYQLFGAGLGNFPYIYPRYQDILHMSSFINYAHNDWVQLLAEGGIIGLLLLIGGIGYYLVTVLRKWKSADDAFAVCLGIAPVIALISLGIHSYSDFNLHMPANMILLIALIAIGYRAFFTQKDRNDQGSVYIPLKTKAILIIVFFLTLTTWSGTWIVRHFTAEAYCNTIQTPPLNLNQHPDLSSIHEAIAWDDGNAQYKFKLAEALMVARDKNGKGNNSSSFNEQYSDRIIRSLEEAIHLNPFNVEHHLRLGWEYSYLWNRKEFTTKWLPAADLCMERASHFNGEGVANPHRHIDLGKYWTMRSTTLVHDPARQDEAWVKARWHFKKAMDLRGGKETAAEIDGYVKSFYTDDQHRREVFE
jgi:O-antigen ligase